MYLHLNCLYIEIIFNLVELNVYIIDYLQSDGDSDGDLLGSKLLQVTNYNKKKWRRQLVDYIKVAL